METPWRGAPFLFWTLFFQAFSCYIYLLPQTYIKQIKDYIEEKGNAVLPLPACISPLMSTNQSTSDSCCM